MPKKQKQKQKQKQIVKQSVVVKVGEMPKKRSSARRAPVRQQSVKKEPERPYYAPVSNPSGPIVINPPYQRSIYPDASAEYVRELSKAFNTKFEDLKKYQGELLREHKAEGARLRDYVKENLQKAFVPQGSNVDVEERLSQNEYGSFFNRQGYNYLEPRQNEVARNALEVSPFDVSLLRQELLRDPYETSQYANIRKDEGLTDLERFSLVPERQEIDIEDFEGNVFSPSREGGSEQPSLFLNIRKEEEQPKGLEEEFRQNLEAGQLEKRDIETQMTPLRTEDKAITARREIVRKVPVKNIGEEISTQTENELEEAFGVPVFVREKEGEKKKGGRPKKIPEQQRIEEFKEKGLTEEQIQDIFVAEEKQRKAKKEAKEASKVKQNILRGAESEFTSD
jgi:hypothetical protein